MFEGICDSGDDVSEFVCKVKNCEVGVKLMGFGYCVYKNYDLWVCIVKEQVDKILVKFGGDDFLLGIVKEFEEVVLIDDYFIECKFYFNVDFYIGLIYWVFGFLIRMFIVLFVLGRFFGWIVYWCEMYDEGDSKIGWFCQIYIGYMECDYVIIDVWQVGEQM